MSKFNYTIICMLSVILYSCGFNKPLVIKNNNSISFYTSTSNNKYQEFLLDDNGVIRLIKIYKDGKLDIEWIPEYSNITDHIEYYGNGQIKTKGFLKNNEKHSLWSYYDREGHLLVERYFSYGKPSNIWIWYDHHNHEIDHYTIYTNNRDDGFLKRFYQSSNIKEEKSYSSNKLNGSYKLFYDNLKNSIHIKGSYEIGVKVGNWESFNEKKQFQDLID